MSALLVGVSPTVPDLITFALCAAVALSGAIGVVTSRNAVHAALSLVATLIAVAVLFIEQDAQFLAAVQIIVYAGAIVVLFLFVIMYLGVDRQENIATETLRGQRPLAVVLTLISLGGLLALAATANWVTGAHHVAGATTAGGHTNTYLLGKSVFTTYLWAFEITAGLLVVAVVGAVVLARRPAAMDDPVDEPGEDAGAVVPPPTTGDPGQSRASGPEAARSTGPDPHGVGEREPEPVLGEAAGR